MHDVGKIAIGDDILLKPDKLTTGEFETIKEHTTLGAEMLAEGKSEIIKMAETIALYHHERWDGQGYPRGLREKQIPLVARICKVADVFDALISERPYKKPWPVKEAVNEIIIRKGTHFDPKIVSAFIKILPDLIKKFNLKEAPAEFDKNGKWGRSV
jgi:putative two-component system response regulator